jgi:DNA-directed RNA polymerase specialized sigma24 family protein
MERNAADRVLREYAESSDEAAAERLLESLIVDYAQTGIRKIVSYKLAFQGAAEAQDVEDVASEVLVELISRLRAVREGTAEREIASFSSYTAVAAYHACNEYLRRKYPNRHRLKARLRYLLSTEKRLAVWEDARSEWLCGFPRWQSEGRAPVAAARLQRWTEELPDVPRGRDTMHPADLMTRIFEGLGAPIELDGLVEIVGQIWGVEDVPAAPESVARDVDSGADDPGARLDLRRWLAELWAQIRELPQPQRAALLLNLRCSAENAAAGLLPLTGVASIREIARALEWPAEELAAIWNRLPLDDLAIADRLGVSRQRVINLRKSARERLFRRMGTANLGNMRRGLPSTNA